MYIVPTMQQGPRNSAAPEGVPGTVPLVAASAATRAPVAQNPCGTQGNGGAEPLVGLRRPLTMGQPLQRRPCVGHTWGWLGRMTWGQNSFGRC